MKTLNDFFDKIYCINLDRRPDRFEKCQIEFEKINADVVRIPAIDGKLVYKAGMSISVGAYGLLLTHIQILNDVIANKYERILILEDDASFIDGFNDYFNEKISSLPDDWDLLYLGGNNVFSQGRFNLVTGDKNFIVRKENYKTLNHELCKTTWTQCAHALGINSKLIPILLERISANLTPVDMIHCNLQQNYNAYTFLPSLVMQRPDFSDIEGRFYDYTLNSANSF